MEASAYFGTAVLLDNQHKYQEAIESYERFATLIEQSDESKHTSTSEAHNCIGVNYMLLACSSSDMGCMESYVSTEQNDDFLESAIISHNR